MDREPLHRLAAKCRIAAMEIPVGSIWKHTRSGGLYEVTGFSIAEATGELHVVYRPIIPETKLHVMGVVHERDVDGLQFNRPHSEWFEMVQDAKDKIKDYPEQAPRFMRVRRREIFEVVSLSDLVTDGSSL